MELYTIANYLWWWMDANIADMGCSFYYMG